MKRLVAAVLLSATLGCGGVRSPAPAREPAVRPLVVYLHGMLQEKATREMDERVRQELEAAGFEVWAPEGKKGVCDWSDEARKAVCWPSDERSMAQARELLREWEPRLASRPVVVVGFSNGGAFAVLLALHGLVPACGFASLHGFPAGALQAGTGPRAPVLLVGGKGASWESGQLTTTSAHLKQLGWPHEAEMHEGGHAVSDEDLRTTVAFARRSMQSHCPPASPAMVSD